MKKKLDLVGKKINKLTVIEKIPYSGGRSRFKCECECGNKKEFDGPKLNSGRIKSCGCLKYSEEYKISLSKRRRLKWGESLKNRIVDSYKRNAKIKGYEFNLTNKQLETLFKEDCYYCGRKPYKTITKHNFYGDFTYNGIDRLLNTKGYTIDNVVPCCQQCNFLKNSYDVNDFIDIIIMIYENLKIKRIDSL